MAKKHNAGATASHAAAKKNGAKGGRVGGPARAEALTGAQRSAIAKEGARARWGAKKPGSR